MKSSKILLRAAELIEYEDYEFHKGCCHAIRIASQNRFREYDTAMWYFWYLAPKRLYSTRQYWFGNLQKKKNQNRRELALMFAAAIAESEGN